MTFGLCVTLSACNDPPATTPEPAPNPPDAPVDEAARILDRVVEAERSLLYVGQKRTIHGKPGASRESMARVTRYANGQSLLEWLEGNRTGERWVYADRTFWLKRPDLLLANYDVEVLSEEAEPVAWRPTRKIRITGKHAGRPSLELRVDAETFLVLHETRYGFDGTVRQVQFFETIDFEAVAGDALPPAEVEVLGAREPGTDATPTDWKPLVASETPDGFKLIERDLLDCGTYCEYWSDGLAAFLLHQRPRSEAAPEGADPCPTEGEITERVGAGRSVLEGVFHGLEIGVSGNLPAPELEAVVRGLQLVR